MGQQHGELYSFKHTLRRGTVGYSKAEENLAALAGGHKNASAKSGCRYKTVIRDQSSDMEVESREFKFKAS
jgi:hypothetical protein